MNRTVLSVFDIEPFRIGGVEMFARELSTQLDGRGWNSVVCFITPPTEAVRTFLTLPNVTVEVLPNVERFGWQPMAGFSALLRRHRPEIVHLQFTPFLSPYPWLARLHGAKRVFFTDQGSRPEGYIPRRAPFWKRLAVRSINLPMSAVICVSNFNRRCMAETGRMPAERIRTIYNAVDLTRVSSNGDAGLAFRQRYSIPVDRPLVVQVSWIIPEKGFPDMLEAARLVLAHEPDVWFAFVGEGASRNEYSRRTAEMGLSERIIWTGPVADPLTNGVYAAADFVCQPSRWQEACAWTIVEAMSSRKPVVGTRIGGIPEAVEDGETGYLVPPGNPPALAEKMLSLLRDSALRERMGEAGRRVVETRFNLETNVAELLRTYGIA